MDILGIGKKIRRRKRHKIEMSNIYSYNDTYLKLRYDDLNSKTNRTKYENEQLKRVCSVRESRKKFEKLNDLRYDAKARIQAINNIINKNKDKK